MERSLRHRRVKNGPLQESRHADEKSRNRL